MPQPNPRKSAPVTSLDEARLLKDMAAIEVAERTVATLKEQLRADRARWSADNGYCVVLRPEQIAREITSREARGNG